MPPKLTSRCENCGKTVNLNTGGSLTGWLFRRAECRCESEKSVLVAGGKHDLSLQSAGHPHPNGSRIDSPGAPGSVPGIEPWPNLGSRYQVLSLIGKGGMGTVYKVKDKELDKIFAVKVLHSEFSSDAQAIKRFEQEAEAAQTLAQANLIVVHEHGLTPDGKPFLIMELAEGESLAEILSKTGKLAADRAIGIFIQMCDALAHAHHKGIVHRDLKPSNVMVCRDESGQDLVKIVDFGIAKLQTWAGRETQNLTQTGDVLGSPAYMSPEQCLGFELDSRSDIYSLGCLMYEVLTGDLPFGGENAIQIISKHLSQAPPRFATSLVRDQNATISGINSKLANALENVVFSCIEKEASHRYQSMENVRDALTLVHHGSKPNLGKSRAARHRRNLIRCGVASIALLPLSILGLVAMPYLRALFFLPDYAKFHSRAIEMANLRRYDDTEYLLRLAIRKAEAEHASDTDLFPLYYDLGANYFDMKQYPRAVEAYRHSLSLKKGISGKCLIANNLERIGQCLLAQHRLADGSDDKSEAAFRDYDEGIQLTKSALKLKESDVGPDHDYCMYTLDILAELYTARGDFANAEACWRRVIFIDNHTPMEKVKVPQHLASLARTLMIAGKKKGAKDCCRQAIAACIELNGPNSDLQDRLQKYFVKLLDK